MKTNIDDLLKKVAEYFKQKLLTGDYEFVKCGEHVAEIRIDKKYTFKLWIANDPEYNFGFYGQTFQEDFMQLRTQKERLAGWRRIKPYIQDYKNTILKRAKQKQFNQLKKELKALK